jgi:hypothetical protein
MPRLKRSPEQIATDIQEQHKTCCVCGERKHFDLFYNYKNKSDNKSYRCKLCDDKARRKWSTENPQKAYESMRGRNLKFRFNLSIDEYKQMLSAQGGKCAICEATENNTTGDRKDWNFAVDHDHKTGKIRGLLCNNCNRGLGLLQDSAELLLKAKEYLETH